MINIFKTKVVNVLFYRLPLGEVLTKITDIGHHLKYSFNEKSLGSDKAQLKYYLTKHYHIIEKGLALPEPRLGFGQPKILDVIGKTTKYEGLFGSDHLTDSIRKTISEYMTFNSLNSYEFPKEFELDVVAFISQDFEGGIGGLKNISKGKSTNLDMQGYRGFAESRVSVRDFSTKIVDDATIYSAVDIAKSAPSVCNRQGWKVHYYSDKSEIVNILSYQNGNAGFTNVIDKLIIVTADSKAFTRYESNQTFIDGGLFSMNLLLAIHSAGLGACCLNTCYPFYIENKVKKISAIPKNERLIMMIGVGHLKENYNVAYSPRNPTDSIFSSHLNK